MVLHGRLRPARSRWTTSGSARCRMSRLLVIPEGLRASDGGQFWNATRECCDYDVTGVDVSHLMALADEVQVDTGGGPTWWGTRTAAGCRTGLVYIA